MTKLVHHGQGQLVFQILVVEVALHGQVQSLRHLHPLVVDQHCLVSDLDTLDTPVVHGPLHQRLGVDVEGGDLSLQPLILGEVDHDSGARSEVSVRGNSEQHHVEVS